MSKKTIKMNRIIYENNWYHPVVVMETKVKDGVWLLKGLRRGSTVGDYYGHSLHFLAYGKHSRQVAIRKLIEMAEKSNWDTRPYWTKAKVFKHCQELDLGPYGAEELIREETGIFIY